MRTLSLIVVLVLAAPLSAAELSLDLLEGEVFWGGCVTDGESMPFGDQDFQRRLLGDTRGNRGYAGVKDQFLLGEEVLVAPVLRRGARQRTVVFPPGRWRGEDGSVVAGPNETIVSAPIGRLPWYRRISP